MIHHPPLNRMTDSPEVEDPQENEETPLMTMVDEITEMWSEAKETLGGWLSRHN